MGSYAVELAAILGGTVTATGPLQRDFVLGLGATSFLAPGPDGTAGYKAVAPDGFDVVIDTIGGSVLDASYGVTSRAAGWWSLSAPPSADKAAALGVQAMFFIVTPDAAELAKIARLVDEGKLRPVVSQVFPLRDGREAFESERSRIRQEKQSHRRGLDRGRRPTPPMPGTSPVLQGGVRPPLVQFHHAGRDQLEAVEKPGELRRAARVIRVRRSPWLYASTAVVNDAWC